MDSRSSAGFNIISREKDLDKLFDIQWPSIYKKIFGTENDDILIDAVDELSKKYRQFLNNYPNQNFVESPLGKLHILDFVGALASLYAAKNLHYENNWPLSSVFDMTLSAFYVDEKVATNILEKVTKPEPSHKEIWKSIYKFVGLAHFKALSENYHEESDLDDISLSGKTRSAISSDEYENVTPVDELYQDSNDKFPHPFTNSVRLSDSSTVSKLKQAPIAKVSYCVDELLSKQTGLCVRGETLWAIRSPDDTSFLLRDIWQDEEEVSKELELYRKAKERKVINLATVLHSETVMIDEGERKVDSTWYGIREGLSIPLTQRKLVNVDNDDGLIFFQSKKPPKSLEGACEYYTPRNPTHFRQVFEFIKPLTQATSLEGIFYGFRDAIKCHQSLGERASILHRNITPRNIMISQDEKIGFLYSLNGALEFKSASGPSNSWEWGYVSLRAFVAMELLHTKVYIEHNFYHDLESFFWCLLWESVHNNGPDLSRQECVELDCWNTMTCKDLRRAKLAIASNDEFFEELMARKITEFFKPSLPYIRKLRKSVFVESPNYYDPKLYKWMIQVFDDALKDFALGILSDNRAHFKHESIISDSAGSLTPRILPISPLSPTSPRKSRILKSKSLRMSQPLPSPVSQRYPSYLRPKSELNDTI